MKVFRTVGLILALATPAMGQQPISADDSKQVFDVTKNRWVAVKEYDGKDFLDFGHLLAWRCGLESIRYSVNDGAEKQFQMEPCYIDDVAPNAQVDLTFPPFVSFDLGAIETVDVVLEYDDGSTDSASYRRSDILTN